MKMYQGIEKIKSLCNNAKLPVKVTEVSAGFDLIAAYPAVVSAHDKVLVQTVLSVVMPSPCYGRIAWCSGLTLGKSIDVGAGVLGADYRGEINMILLKFW